MMQRLFELELRAASMRVSVPSARAITQASNFSLRRRSAAPEFMVMASMPNCLKHSASSALEGSLNPTNAALAAAFRLMEKDVRVVSKALSMIGEDSTFERHCASDRAHCKVPKDQRTKQRRVITKFTEAGERTLRDDKHSRMRKLHVR